MGPAASWRSVQERRRADGWRADRDDAHWLKGEALLHLEPERVGEARPERPARRAAA